MVVLFKLFLTFNATSLILVVYLVKSSFLLSEVHPIFNNFSPLFSYGVYLFILISLNYVALYISKFLDNDNLQVSSIKDIELANNSYLPSYLGYFFVALSISDIDTLIFIYLILFIFTYFSQTLYFNPFYLIFNYHFYYVTTNNNIKLFLITKKIIKNPNINSFQELKRINDFTFIDRERKK